MLCKSRDKANLVGLSEWKTGGSWKVFAKIYSHTTFNFLFLYLMLYIVFIDLSNSSLELPESVSRHHHKLQVMKYLPKRCEIHTNFPPPTHITSPFFIQAPEKENHSTPITITMIYKTLMVNRGKMEMMIVNRNYLCVSLKNNRVLCMW